MNFQVPQFIDIEDRIVGPLTLKQFGFIAVAFLLSIGLFYILAFWFWVIITVFLASLAAGLAFTRVSGRALAPFLLSAFTFYWRPRRFLWQHEIPSPLRVSIPEIKEIRLPSAPPGAKTKRFALPKFELKIPTITITKKPELKPTSITTGAGLQSLSEKLMTTKSAIPDREKPFAWLRRRPRDKYEILQKLTGERISAKRIDYR